MRVTRSFDRKEPRIARGVLPSRLGIDGAYTRDPSRATKLILKLNKNDNQRE
jgi:hypothetical protein